jgi:transcriptional regulator with XRE-family HTH domain
MTKEELKEHLKSLGWSQGQLAKTLGVDISTVNRWVNSDAEIPGPVVAYVELAIDVLGLYKRHIG